MPTGDLALVISAALAAALLIFFLLHSRRKSHKRQQLLEVELDNLNPEAEKQREIERLRTRISAVLQAQGGSQNTTAAPVRFSASIVHLRFGERAAAAHGLLELLNADDPAAVQRGVAEGFDAIEREVMANGTDVDKECFDYVVRRAAGSSDKLFPNSPYPRDCDANGVRADRLTTLGEGMLLADFRSHPHAVAARLTLVHVLVLRLYSTAAFASINQPLRMASDKDRASAAAAHPFPVLVMLLAEAIKKLRAVPARVVHGAGEETSTVELWRGLRDAAVPDEFITTGGTENAPMSTTRSLEVAMRYSASAMPMLMRLNVGTFMQLGADLSFVSAFPDEDEVLYPPLTYLESMSPPAEVKVGEGVTFTIVDVKPFIS